MLIKHFHFTPAQIDNLTLTEIIVCKEAIEKENTEQPTVLLSDALKQAEAYKNLSPIQKLELGYLLYG